MVGHLGVPLWGGGGSGGGLGGHTSIGGHVLACLSVLIALCIAATIGFGIVAALGSCGKLGGFVVGKSLVAGHAIFQSGKVAIFVAGIGGDARVGGKRVVIGRGIVVKVEGRSEFGCGSGVGRGDAREAVATGGMFGREGNVGRFFQKEDEPDGNQCYRSKNEGTENAFKAIGVWHGERAEKWGKKVM